MKRYVPLALDTCAVVALALWLGGLAVCWMVLALTVRGLPPSDLTVGHAVFGETLRRFSAVAEACGVVLVAIQWVLRRRYQRDRRLFVVDGSRTLILFAALFCAECGRYSAIPALLRTQATGAYTTLVALAIAQAVLLVGYAAVTGWLQFPRTPTRLAARPVDPPRPRQGRPAEDLHPAAAPKRRAGR